MAYSVHKHQKSPPFKKKKVAIFSDAYQSKPHKKIKIKVLHNT